MSSTVFSQPAIHSPVARDWAPQHSSGERRTSQATHRSRNGNTAAFRVDGHEALRDLPNKLGLNAMRLRALALEIASRPGTPLLLPVTLGTPTLVDQRPAVFPSTSSNNMLSPPSLSYTSVTTDIVTVADSTSSSASRYRKRHETILSNTYDALDMTDRALAFALSSRLQSIMPSTPSPMPSPRPPQNQHWDRAEVSDRKESVASALSRLPHLTADFAGDNRMPSPRVVDHVNSSRRNGFFSPFRVHDGTGMTPFSLGGVGSPSPFASSGILTSTRGAFVDVSDGGYFDIVPFDDRKTSYMHSTLSTAFPSPSKLNAVYHAFISSTNNPSETCTSTDARKGTVAIDPATGWNTSVEQLPCQAVDEQTYHSGAMAGDFNTNTPDPMNNTQQRMLDQQSQHDPFSHVSLSSMKRSFPGDLKPNSNLSGRNSLSPLDSSSACDGTITECSSPAALDEETDYFSTVDGEKKSKTSDGLGSRNPGTGMGDLISRTKKRATLWRADTC